MKEKNFVVLDNEDEKAVQLFAELGMPKNLAKTLLYIYQVDECKTSDIEQCADLRQPEVSVAIRELRKKGWIKTRYVKKSGKGRPNHVYKPATTLSDVMKTFEQEKLKDVETIQNDMVELEHLLSNR
ncbi:MAG: ArsR family transcriptional regulator [Euryarchaeota archaeon]|nr:ArsR family transcriptional regulator [Euryarchaeota archaeon]